MQLFLAARRTVAMLGYAFGCRPSWSWSSLPPLRLLVEISAVAALGRACCRCFSSSRSSVLPSQLSVKLVVVAALDGLLIVTLVQLVAKPSPAHEQQHVVSVQTRSSPLHKLKLLTRQESPHLCEGFRVVRLASPSFTATNYHNNPPHGDCDRHHQQLHPS